VKGELARIVSRIVYCFTLCSIAVAAGRARRGLVSTYYGSAHTLIQTQDTGPRRHATMNYEHGNDSLFYSTAHCTLPVTAVEK